MMMITAYTREEHMPRRASISSAAFGGAAGFTAAFCVASVANA